MFCFFAQRFGEVSFFFPGVLFFLRSCFCVFSECFFAAILGGLEIVWSV